MKKLAVIGGGAAGFAAAIAAGERSSAQGVQIDIALYERDERVGRSILATGNGRCNFTNASILPGLYHNHAFVMSALDELAQQRGKDAVMDFFESCGLEWRQEDDGRRYPLANKASVVVDVLRAAAKCAGVREVCEWPVAAIVAPQAAGKRFTLHRADGVLDRADAVVVACGGRALGSLDVAGMKTIRQQPKLGPLRVVDSCIPFVRELDNIRVRCSVRLMRPQKGEMVCAGSESGELMFRKYGISGICVFNLSRLAQPGDTIQIDFLRISDFERACDYLKERRKTMVARFGEPFTYEDMLRGLVLPRVGDVLLKRAGIKPNTPFKAVDAAGLARLLGAFSLEITGIADPSLCQVHRGGFSVDEFDALTMSAKGIPGLFAAGEALDVDGPCGGYNLHWAWSSGLLAGDAAARLLCAKP